MFERIAKIKDKLEFERDKIEPEIGEFEIVDETEESVIIETEFEEKYEVWISHLTSELNISRM